MPEETPEVTATETEPIVTPEERLKEIFDAFEANGAPGIEDATNVLFVLDGEGGGSHLLSLAPGKTTWNAGYEGEADVSVKLSVEDFFAIADGKFDGRLGIASERLEVSGDLDKAALMLRAVAPIEAG